MSLGSKQQFQTRGSVQTSSSQLAVSARLVRSGFGQSQAMNLAMIGDGIGDRNAAGLTNAAVWRLNVLLFYGVKPGEPC
jgi:hypothetical protein